MIAQEVGLELGWFAHSIVDAHIYTAKAGAATSEYDHLEGLKAQLLRTPLALPRLQIARKPFDELTFDDFKLVGYECQEAIRFKVAV
jgi:thymidylate synthase